MRVLIKIHDYQILTMNIITTYRNLLCLSLLIISVSNVKQLISVVKKIVSGHNKRNKFLNLKSLCVARVQALEFKTEKKIAKFMEQIISTSIADTAAV